MYNPRRRSIRRAPRRTNRRTNRRRIKGQMEAPRVEEHRSEDDIFDYLDDSTEVTPPPPPHNVFGHPVNMEDETPHSYVVTGRDMSLEHAVMEMDGRPPIATVDNAGGHHGGPGPVGLPIGRSTGRSIKKKRAPPIKSRVVKVPKKCLQCDNPQRESGNYGAHCSQDCRAKSQMETVPRNGKCINCGETAPTGGRYGKYCSSQCREALK